MRKIAVVTGARSEYGLLYWIIKGIHDDPDLELQLIVTGMHLSPEFGLTVTEIESDGLPIAERAEILLSSDTETAVATSMGIGMMAFAKAYERLKPDILVVLGDRFEIFSAVAAAVPLRIPIAHIHGGESTEGAFDEQLRHAMTKMSHVHFTSTEKYRSRVIQMGENPQYVFCCGAPGVDNIQRLALLSKEELFNALELPTESEVGVVTYHPATLDNGDVESQAAELLRALKEIPNVYWVFTMPNADTGGRIITNSIDSFLATHPEVGRSYASLGQLRYLSLLKHASIMVGNSSSGIIEAPSFELPVVNIGPRQQGRVRGENVIDIGECDADLIIGAIAHAMSNAFRASLRDMINPYGTGSASEFIVEKLKSMCLEHKIIRKRFHEVV